MTRKSYTVEFKQQAVQLALSGEKSKTQTARELGITENMLYNWITKFGPEALPEATDDKAEIARLRKALARPEMERDIQKTRTSEAHGKGVARKDGPLWHHRQ